MVKIDVSSKQAKGSYRGPEPESLPADIAPMIKTASGIARMSQKLHMVLADYPVKTGWLLSHEPYDYVLECRNSDNAPLLVRFRTADKAYILHVHGEPTERQIELLHHAFKFQTLTPIPRQGGCFGREQIAS